MSYCVCVGLEPGFKRVPSETTLVSPSFGNFIQGDKTIKLKFGGGGGGELIYTYNNYIFLLMYL